MFICTYIYIYIHSASCLFTCATSPMYTSLPPSPGLLSAHLPEGGAEGAILALEESAACDFARHDFPMYTSFY